MMSHNYQFCNSRDLRAVHKLCNALGEKVIKHICCCRLIKTTSKIVILALPRREGVEFVLKLFNAIYEWCLVHMTDGACIWGIISVTSFFNGPKNSKLKRNSIF